MKKTTITLLALAVLLALSGMLRAEPTVLDPALGVRSVVTGLTTPTSMAFLGQNDFLVLEKNTGKVKRVMNGSVSTVLELPVNSASERGMLGIALHPNFPSNPGVYLFWTESLTGKISDDVAETPVLGNRVDRFVWNGSNLVFDLHLIRLRALQPAFELPDRTTEREGGNHNGGKLAFGPDAKLYITVGDVGRRGQMQNLPFGPLGRGIQDDPFGGPEPDDTHLTGVILRLNDDGSTPGDNPFFAVGAQMNGEAGENIQRVFAYGFRNSFGMEFDPFSGLLWASENGDDSFDQLNQVEPGMNGGWIQIMGPAERLGDYKSIELQGDGALQQLRWPPKNIADTLEEAKSRLFVVPGSHFKGPEFSWKFAMPPAGLGFMSSRALGPEFEGNLFLGLASDRAKDGPLFRFKLSADRKTFSIDDPRLVDRVADNMERNDLTESESLLFGQDFGVVTDIKTGPNGNLFVVSHTDEAVYEIFRK